MGSLLTWLGGALPLLPRYFALALVLLLGEQSLPVWLVVWAPHSTLAKMLNAKRNLTMLFGCGRSLEGWRDGSGTGLLTVT